MRQLCNPTAVAIRPAAATPSANGWATTGSPGVQPATLIDADTFNSWQAEFINLLAANEETPNPASDTQILTAIQALIAGAIGAVPTVDTGDIKAWPGAAPPSGWLLMNGAAVSRATYAALFAVIGTTYGAGDGSTTFNLPNGAGRFLIGAGGAISLGGVGGEESAAITTDGHALTIAEMPAHAHTDAGHAHTDGGHSHADAGHGHVDGGHNHADAGHGHVDAGHTHQVAGVVGNQNGATNNLGGAGGVTAGPSTFTTGEGAAAIGTGNANIQSAQANIETGHAVIETGNANIEAGYASLENTGGGGAHTHTATVPIMPPFLAINWVIKT